METWSPGDSYEATVPLWFAIPWFALLIGSLVVIVVQGERNPAPTPADTMKTGDQQNGSFSDNERECLRLR